MKYIRTKDGIILERFYKRALEVADWIGDTKHSSIQIIAEADTIEELCDAYVLKNISNIEANQCLVFDLLDDLFDCEKQSPNIKNEVYGAIWTKWGLKYVAKMNEKGEMELL